MIALEEQKQTPSSDASNKDVLRLSIVAGRWQFLSMLGQQVLNFGTFLILARILLPEDFGIIALMAIVPSFLDGVTSFSLDTGALQKRGRMGEYLNVVWTFNIGRAAIIFLITLIGAPFIAAFFKIPQALPLLYLAGAGILIQSLMNIGLNYLFLTLEFKKIFARDMILKGSYAISVIVLALVLRSYWALFLANILSLICVMIATYYLHPYRPRPDFNFSLLKDLRGFSQWLYAQEIAGQIGASIKDSVIGRYTSATGLGLLSKAKALAAAPTGPIASTINKVSFSSYVRVQDSLAHAAEGLSKTFDILVTIALPYIALIAFTGNRIVLIALGEKWTAITPLLKILVIAMTLDVLSTQVAASVFNGLGKPRIQFFIGSMYAAITLLGFLLFVPTGGVMAAAYVILAGSACAAIVTTYFFFTTVGVRLARIGWSMSIAALATFIPIPLALWCLSIPFFNTTLGYLVLIAGAGLVYAGIIIFFGVIFKKGPFATFLLLVQSMLGSLIASRNKITSSE